LVLSPERRAKLLGVARAAWPGVVVPDEVFFAHVEGRGGDAELEDGQAADLFLACACARGESHALALFERHFIGPARAALARFENAGVVDDALQDVRAKLLVAAGGAPPRIAEFAGQGTLDGWVKVAALRAALDLVRRVGRTPSVADEDIEVAEAALAVQARPELELVKAEYKGEFAACVRAGLAALTPKERSLLRFNVIENLNIAAIGAIYGVHRATVARWIADARAHVLEGTRAALRARLRLGDDEVDSMIRALSSQLELSLHGLLRSTVP
jgi:RNA polymerase sigma-70 factor (ECF subfamily)